MCFVVLLLACVLLAEDEGASFEDAATVGSAGYASGLLEGDGDTSHDRQLRA